MLVADSSSILNDSVVNEDAVIDQGYDEEDDNENIEEEPDFFLYGEHGLSSERQIPVLKMNPAKQKGKSSALVNV